jgi:hypothetical protein
MKIYIPVHDNIEIEKRVLDAINSQVGEFEVAIVDCTFDKTIPKRRRIAMSKEKLRQRAIADGEESCIFHDSDILNLNNNNFIDLNNFLQKNREYGAVSLYRSNSDIHVCNSVMIVRKKALSKLSFGDDKLRVTCYAVASSLKAAGWRYGYIDKEIRISHLGRSLLDEITMR